MKRDESQNVKIVSGGQTGVDRGALEAAMALGLDFGGWAPHGWIAEGGTIPAQYRERMQVSSALVLNVAGPRESKVPGILARAKAFLEEMLWEA
ncbi:MAG: hypothetical protein IKF72_13710 [Kiritimatiellae bacterium]|nr:hypothetical protein [Kiritimatiellia bacterium]